MQELLNIALFVAGLVMIIKGADWVTEYGSRLAKSIGVSELVIGLTLVALATSLPELSVSVISAFSGVAEIATGTIIGSNVSNIALILGIAAFISPMAIQKRYINQGLVTLGFSLLVAIMLVGGLEWFEGSLLLLLFIGYMVYSLKHRKEVGEKFSANTESGGFKRTKKGSNNAWKYGIYCVIGGLFVVLGATLMVDSTVSIAEWAGVPEMVIAIIVIGVGTSLPELATSVTAAFKKMPGISIGNIAGSNIFNIAILGLTSLASAVPVTAHLMSIDIPVMVALTVLLLLFMRTGWNLSRKEGLVLLAIYAAFVYLQFV